MRGSIKIGRLLGIPIAVDYSWFLSLLFFLSVFAVQVFPRALPHSATWVHWALALVSVIIFFGCIILHELGHSAVALHYGIPVKGITLFVLGGVSQITREASRPLPELLMALAGPFVSLLLGGTLILLWFVLGQVEGAVGTLLVELGILNISLGVFNLLPAFPLDGGRVLRASLWGLTHNMTRATRWAVWTARVIAWTLIGFGLLSASGADLLPVELERFSGLWMAMIGFFLLQNATASLRQARMMEELGRYRIRDVMVKDIPSVLLGEPVRQLLSALSGYGPSREWLLVSGSDHFAGVIPRATVTGVPEDAWDTRVAADLMIPAASLRPIKPEQTLADLFQAIQEHGARVMPVLDGGEVSGLVHDGIIGRVLRGRRDLGTA